LRQLKKNQLKKITESDSKYDNLEQMGLHELLSHINKEDKTVPTAVENSLPQIEALVNAVSIKMKEGGRLFYLGAGTSGRLGVVDASECPPTFGVPDGLVVGIIAGGDRAIRYPVEFAEDDTEQGWKDLLAYDISSKDVVVGIAASGSTPYVIGAIKMCRFNKIITGCITCNPGSPLALTVDFPVEVNVGPEFVTGSTRMKSGTAQKLVLNMLSTATMIKLGRVKGNKMVDMMLSNDKLVDRGVRMVMAQTGLNNDQASKLLLQFGSVRKAVESIKK